MTFLFSSLTFIFVSTWIHPFWVDMAMDAIQVPTSCFMETPKSKRMCTMGKVGVKIGTYFLFLKYWLGLSKANTVNYCPIAIK